MNDPSDLFFITLAGWIGFCVSLVTGWIENTAWLYVLEDACWSCLGMAFLSKIWLNYLNEALLQSEVESQKNKQTSGENSSFLSK